MFWQKKWHGLAALYSKLAKIKIVKYTIFIPYSYLLAISFNLNVIAGNYMGDSAKVDFMQ